MVESQCLKCQKSVKSLQLGFTLIELMVTIAVMGVIVSLAAPNVSQQLAAQRVNNTTSMLATALKQAKTESAIRRLNVSVIIDDTNKTITVQDQASPINKIAQYQLKAASSIKINPTTQTTVTFAPNHRVVAPVATLVTYTLCDTNTNITPKKISVDAVANITTTTTTAGSC